MTRNISFSMYRPGDVDVLYVRLFQDSHSESLELHNRWAITDRDREKDMGIMTIKLYQDELKSIDLSEYFGIQLTVLWKDGYRYTFERETLSPGYVGIQI